MAASPGAVEIASAARLLENTWLAEVPVLPTDAVVEGGGFTEVRVAAVKWTLEEGRFVKSELVVVVPGAAVFGATAAVGDCMLYTVAGHEEAFEGTIAVAVLGADFEAFLVQGDVGRAYGRFRAAAGERFQV